MARRRPIRRRDRGAAYVLALVALVAGSIFALAALRSGNAYFISEDSRARKQTAQNLAEAGVDYAYWQVHYQHRPLPYSADVTLSGGSFHVDAVDDGSRDPSTMLITSTGTFGRRKYVTKRVTIGQLPYHYAYCENRSAEDVDAVVSTSAGRGVRANGQVKLDSFSNNVTNGAWATTVVTCRGTVTPQYPNCPPIAFPEIDTAYYQSICTHYFNGDTIIASINPAADALVFINGRLNVRGGYRGYCTIVTTGDITIGADLFPLDSNSYLALVTRAHIIVPLAANDVHAILYSHRWDAMGEINISGFVTFTGAAASDNNITTDTTTFNFDPRLNMRVFRRLRLPGL